MAGAPGDVKFIEVFSAEHEIAGVIVSSWEAAKQFSRRRENSDCGRPEVSDVQVAVAVHGHAIWFRLVSLAKGEVGNDLEGAEYSHRVDGKLYDAIREGFGDVECPAIPAQN